MRRLLLALLLPLAALATEELPKRITPIFTKEAVGEAVTITVVPGVRAASKPTGDDAAFAIFINGTAVTFTDIHPLTARALQNAATKKTPLNFTVQTYRSEGPPSGRIHADYKLIEKKRPQSKDGFNEINSWDERYLSETPTIVRITNGDETVYDIDACEVHWEPLRVVALPISYGLLMMNERKEPTAWVTAAKFPHAETWRSGGCCIDPGSPSHVEEYVCDACLNARKAWFANPIPEESVAGKTAPTQKKSSPKQPAKK